MKTETRQAIRNFLRTWKVIMSPRGMGGAAPATSGKPAIGHAALKKKIDRKIILLTAKLLRTQLGHTRGCCYESSILLASLLRLGGLNPQVIKGTFSQDTPTPPDVDPAWMEEGEAIHFWVSCSGFLVDIAADQFNGEIGPDKMPKVVLSQEAKASPRYGRGKPVPGRKLHSMNEALESLLLGTSGIWLDTGSNKRRTT